jgi:hypothetical protein
VSLFQWFIRLFIGSIELDREELLVARLTFCRFGKKLTSGLNAKDYPSGSSIEVFQDWLGLSLSSSRPIASSLMQMNVLDVKY